MKYLDLAIRIAKGGSEDRNYLIGCVSLRADGAIVVAPNSWTKEPEPKAHAESRCLNKSGFGATLWVARIVRSGEWACAKPCIKCQALIRNKKVKRVFYTTGPNRYECWNVADELR
jgi:tRNA(Arg) A34 adenosine deaminase TadA